MKIFISYSHKNEESAENLISIINDHIPNTFRFFKAKSNLSTNINSIEFGDWLKTIRKEIIEADIIIGSITQEYLNSKWLFSEVGGAILFNKVVVPICYLPIDKNSLPSPFNSIQSYNYNKDDMPIFLSSLANIANKKILLNKEIKTNNYTKDDNFDKALSIINSVDGIERIKELEAQRKSMGNFLASLFNSYNVSLYMDSEIYSDEYGNCLLSRSIKIKPNNHVIHWYYELYSDGIVEIKEINDIDQKRSLKFLVHEKSDTHIRISILFDRVVKKGEEININIKSYAQYYLYELIKNNLSQTYYNNVRNTKIKQYSQRFSFPNTNDFKELEGYIINAGSKKDMYKRIEPVSVEDRKLLHINLQSKRGFTDRILLELRK